MRVADMPYVYLDKDKNRFEFRRRYPVDVAPHLGKQWFIHKFPQGVTETMANDASHDLVRLFNAEVLAARTRADPATLAAALINRENNTTDIGESIVARAGSLLG